MTANFDELRARLALLHGEARADRALQTGLFEACRIVYSEACRRSQVAEDHLHAAISAHAAARQTEDEWRCIVHGQALVVARHLDERTSAELKALADREASDEVSRT